MANTERGVLQYRDDRDVGLLAGPVVGQLQGSSIVFDGDRPAGQLKHHRIGKRSHRRIELAIFIFVKQCAAHSTCRSEISAPVHALAGSPVGSNPPTITTPSKLTPNAD
jgi:hypothetical protein